VSIGRPHSARKHPVADSTAPTTTTTTTIENKSNGNGKSEDDDDEDVQVKRTIKFNGVDAIECAGLNHRVSSLSTRPSDANGWTGKWCYPCRCTSCGSVGDMCLACRPMQSCSYCPVGASTTSLLCDPCTRRCEVCVSNATIANSANAGMYGYHTDDKRC
jgi:hypothetical protein